MVKVPAGAFLRGSPDGEGNADERPQKSIHIDAFEIDKYEVSVAEYRRCVEAGRCSERHLKGYEWPGQDYKESEWCNWGRSGSDEHPINCVDWNQATAYCTWVGKRLPTEAEWEKAARGTDGRKYPWGNEAPDCGKVKQTGCGAGTAPVRSYEGSPSPYGAVQMAGNVSEWVIDWYQKDYASSPARNAAGPSSGSYRVFRGGCWGNDERHLRAAVRIYSTPTGRHYGLGFRCARNWVDRGK